MYNETETVRPVRVKESAASQYSTSNVSASSSCYRDPYTPPTTPSLPIHPETKVNTLNMSASSIGREVSKLHDQYERLDQMKKDGLMTSTERDMDKARLLEAKSPVFDNLDQTVTQGVKALDETNYKISKLNESSRLLLIRGTKHTRRKKWYACLCNCFRCRSSEY